MKLPKRLYPVSSSLAAALLGVSTSTIRRAAKRLKVGTWGPKLSLTAADFEAIRVEVLRNAPPGY